MSTLYGAKGLKRLRRALQYTVHGKHLKIKLRGATCPWHRLHPLKNPIPCRLVPAQDNRREIQIRVFHHTRPWTIDNPAMVCRNVNAKPMFYFGDAPKFEVRPKQYIRVKGQKVYLFNKEYAITHSFAVWCVTQSLNNYTDGIGV